MTDKAPQTGRITMAGHSGAGATLSNMANEAVRAIAPGTKDLPKAVPSSPLTGDLVIFDAINGPLQLEAFQRWVVTRLNEDVKVLMDNKSSCAASDPAQPEQRGSSPR